MVSNLPSPLHHPNTITQLDNIAPKKRKLEADLEEACYQQVDSDSKLSLWMNTSPQKSSAMDEIPSAPSLNTQQQAEYLYSAGTHKRSRKTTPHPATSGIDLELNLTCGDHLQQNATKLNQSSSANNNKLIPATLSLLSPSPAADEQEMAAAACKRCHLLVMLSKSYPACPNCKFMHPTHNHTPPNLIAQPKPPSLLC